MLTRLQNLLFNIKYKLGLASKEEIIDRLCPERKTFLGRIKPEDRQTFQSYFKRLDDLQVIGDLPQFFETTKALQSELELLSKKYAGEEGFSDFVPKIDYLAGVDAIGYRPAGARIWKFFINPFSIFSFYFENHPACVAALRVWIDEVIHDGYTFDYDEKAITEERLIEVDKFLEDNKFPQMIIDTLRHYMAYGISIWLRHKDPFGNTVRFEHLIMDYAHPVIDKYTNRVVAWELFYGSHAIRYPLEDLAIIHNPSFKYPDLPVSPLGCMVSDLEADLGGTALNNNMVNKAGMVSVLIAMDDPTKDNGLTKSSSDKLVKRFLEDIRANWSGAKAGGGMMVSNFVKNVYKLGQMNEWDGAFIKFRIEVIRSVATLLGVPIGRMNIPLLAQAQYQAASLEDQSGEAFDKRIAATMSTLFHFFNTEILQKGYKIFDVKVVPCGRTSMTLQSAQAGKIASETGGIFTYNEIRTKFYGEKPLPRWSKRGKQIADNSLNRANTSLPAEFADDDPATDAAGNTEHASEEAESEEED